MDKWLDVPNLRSMSIPLSRLFSVFLQIILLEDYISALYGAITDFVTPIHGMSPLTLSRRSGFRYGGKNCLADKKASKKALIPLPPTGLASFFCAIPDVVQTKLQARRAVGPCGRVAVSICARF
jgi:hypothetical protein